MSAFNLYVEERRGIDDLLMKGYSIIGLQDNLDGAIVFLQKEAVIESIQVNIADTRKYLSNVMLHQNISR
ncbi:hypothetical protein [Gracilibacillus salinarum]|uniref:Uncharacterized protein n=1 Tax=Gracilibacillus salinarum TaxID=2932255 RepID=A0ABY4GJQ5_9BACI|nr:hypothetical protein [Gracilibacillus salinarum]UOQ84459.1 hypothetical protein MUN87_17465 [Gracilibacillus salinarum]